MSKSNRFQSAAILILGLLSASTSQADARKAEEPIQPGPQTTYCTKVEELIEKDCMPRFTWKKDVSVVIAVNQDGDIVDASSAKTPDQEKALAIIKGLKKLPAPPTGSKNPYWLSIGTGNTKEEVGVAARDVNFTAYMIGVQKKVKKNWRPPHGLVSNQVKVSFDVYYDGHIDDLKVADSDAAEMYDKAALKATQKASPFAPLPDGSPTKVKIEFVLAYNFMNGPLGPPPLPSRASLAAQAVNFEAKNDYAGAVLVIEQALSLEPDHENTQHQLSNTYVGWAMSELKNKPDDAMKHFEKAKTAWPENPRVPSTIEEAHKMYDASIEDMQKSSPTR